MYFRGVNVLSHITAVGKKECGEIYVDVINIRVHVRASNRFQCIIPAAIVRDIERQSCMLPSDSKT